MSKSPIMNELDKVFNYYADQLAEQITPEESEIEIHEHDFQLGIGFTANLS